MSEYTSRYAVGLDLGQSNDYTALVVAETYEESITDEGLPGGIPKRGTKGRASDTGTVLHVRHVERIRDKSYIDIARDVKKLLAREDLQTVYPQNMLVDHVMVRDAIRVPPRVAVDATGVGRGVSDILRAMSIQFTPVSLTSGRERSAGKGGYKNVPKSEIVWSLVAGLQSGWIRIAKDLEFAEALREELLNYRLKVNINTAHTEFVPWREKEHDDLVLALGMCLFTVSARSRDSRLSGIYRMPPSASPLFQSVDDTD